MPEHPSLHSFRPQCRCTVAARIAADNDRANGSTAQRVIRMTMSLCNRCGGRRP